MKGKNLSGDNNIDLGLGILTNPTSWMCDDYESRKIENTETNEFIVDTCFTFDTPYPETGIQSESYNDGKWIIVSQYKDKEEAEQEHKKWVRFMKTKPSKLKDIFSGIVYERLVN